MWFQVLGKACRDSYTLSVASMGLLAYFYFLVIGSIPARPWLVILMSMVTMAVLWKWCAWAINKWRSKYDRGYQLWKMREDIEKTHRHITAIKLEKVEITGEDADIEADQAVGITMKGLRRLGVKIYDVPTMELGDEIHLLYWEAYFSDMLVCARKKDIKAALECVSRYEDDFKKGPERTAGS